MDMSNRRTAIQIAIFLVLSYFISWTLYLLGYEGIDHFLGFVAKFGFTISAIIVLMMYKEWDFLGRIKDGLVNIKQLKHAWIGFIPFALYLIAVLLSQQEDTMTLRADFSWMEFGYITFIAPNSGILFYMMFRGGLGEEIGLRAFAVPKLNQLFRPTGTALIIGILWSAWHYIVWWQQGIINLLILTLAVIAWSMVYTYLYLWLNSIWTLILLHAVGNASDDILEWLWPNLQQVDWEIPYIALVLLWGIISGFMLFRLQRQGGKNE